MLAHPTFADPTLGTMVVPRSRGYRVLELPVFNFYMLWPRLTVATRHRLLRQARPVTGARLRRASGLRVEGALPQTPAAPAADSVVVVEGPAGSVFSRKSRYLFGRVGVVRAAAPDLCGFFQTPIFWFGFVRRATSRELSEILCLESSKGRHKIHRQSG
jgi:hypothetical protein